MEYSIFSKVSLNDTNINKNDSHLDLVIFKDNKDKKILRINAVPFDLELVVFKKNDKKISALPEVSSKGILSSIITQVIKMTRIPPTSFSTRKAYANFIWIEEKIDIIKFKVYGYRRYRIIKNMIMKWSQKNVLGGDRGIIVAVNEPKLKPEFRAMRSLDLKYSQNYVYSGKVEENGEILNVHYADFKKNNKESESKEFPDAVICSFDIEAHSDTRSFPKASIREDIITMLSAAYGVLNQDMIEEVVYIVTNDEITDKDEYGTIEQEIAKTKPGLRLNNLLELQKLNQHPLYFEGSRIVVCQNEIEVIEEWYNDIIRHRVAIFTGFNVKGFDFEYIDGKIEMNNAYLPNLSLIDYIETKYTSNIWSSSAFGTNILKYITAPGVVCIDIMFWARQNLKLSGYSLNAVAAYFKKPPKEDMSYQDMFILYDDINVLRRLRKFKKDLKISLLEEYENTLTSIKSRMGLMLKYSIRDSVLVYDLLVENVIKDAFVQSKFSFVPISDLFSRGQQSKTQALYAANAREYGYSCIFPINSDIPKSGGHVFIPSQGVSHGVFTIDFSSLYPSISCAYNLCPSTLEHPDFDNPSKELDKPNINVIYVPMNVQEDPEEIMDGSMADDAIVYKDDDDSADPLLYKADEDLIIEKVESTEYPLIFHTERVGLTPRLFDELFTQRKTYKGLMKTNGKLSKTDVRKEEKAQFEMLHEYYNLCQLAVKRLMNSVYGSFGASMSLLYHLPTATAIPTIGRKLISVVAIICKSFHCVLVYGDTDSVMVEVGKKSAAKMVKAWKIMYKEDITISNSKEFIDRLCTVISDSFKGIINIEYENESETFISLKKKRYVKYKTDNKITYKGLPVVRRDKNQFLKDSLITIFRQIKDGEFYKSYKYAIDRTLMLINEEVDVDDLVSTRRVGSNYASQGSLMAQFIMNCETFGINLKTGDRVTLIVTKGDRNAKLGSRCITLGGLKENDMDPDMIYYAWNDLRKNVQAILLVGYMDYLPFIEKYRLVIKLLEYIKEYVDKCIFLPNTNDLRLDLIDGKKVLTEISLGQAIDINVMQTDSLDLQSPFKRSGVNGIGHVLNMVSIYKLVAHMLVNFPPNRKKAHEEMKRILTTRVPVPEIQTNIIEAIVKYKLLSEDDPSIYNFEEFIDKVYNSVKDRSWEYYKCIHDGKSTVGKQKNRKVTNLLNSLNISEELFVNMIKYSPEYHEFTHSSIPRYSKVGYTLSNFGKNVWRLLKLGDIYKTLKVE